MHRGILKLVRTIPPAYQQERLNGKQQRLPLSKNIEAIAKPGNRMTEKYELSFRIAELMMAAAQRIELAICWRVDMSIPLKKRWIYATIRRTIGNLGGDRRFFEDCFQAKSP